MTTTTTTTLAQEHIPELKSICLNSSPANSSTSNLLSMIREIPITYVLEKLHELGPQYLNDKSSAHAELHIDGCPKPYYVHKEYLVLQSNFFNVIFNSGDISNGDVITISLPACELFDPILEYFYDGDADKFYDSLNEGNCKRMWENVEYLGMGAEAKAVCLAYFQNEINGKHE
ncbi:13624_t:CDS:1 [Acaulospora colombiana]|uniref:13624_t:CDS:1 n=1 Tax=Acaulospora colombiana TaxID=27376 RepID=A0ACA9L8Y0_9GLOM|nr:13624_t:CDS:1 [Acaulospora colombiana]